MKKRKICYYDEMGGQLLGNRYTKARIFYIENKIIELPNQENNIKEFNVLFIPRYNVTTHNILMIDNNFTCTCQENKINKRTCSHILAVKMYLNKITISPEVLKNEI